MKKATLSVVSALITLSALAGSYTPDWESLKSTNQMPEWLQDAKFGYYFHWGVQTFAVEEIPFNPWFYPGSMYQEGSETFKYHTERFGHPSEFGWKDVVKAWEPEHFNAKEWVDLFAEGGARFGGCLAVHVDNVTLWDSDLTEWNLKNYGPRTDVLGDMQQAYKSHGMPMVATFHHGVSWTLAFLNAYDFDAADGQHVDLYNEPHKKTDPPTERFIKKWSALVNEVVEKYSPEGLYFDYGLKQVATEKDRLEVFANFYNHCEAQGIDGILLHKHKDVIPGGILDTERGRPPHLWDEPFMNDKSVARRCWYNKTWRIENEGGLYTSSELLCALVDLISKNGVMMLSVAPDQHGRIPEDQQKIIREIGAWLERNGEAVYETRPWVMCGEGPFLDDHRGWHKPQWDAEYTSEDIRFTRSKDNQTYYATVMARPDEGVLVVNSWYLQELNGATIRLLGYGEVPYVMNDKGRAEIQVPKLDGKEWPEDQPVSFAFDHMSVKKHYDLAGTTVQAQQKKTQNSPQEKRYDANTVFTPDWESLSLKQGAPDWLQDAKVGYWACWGPHTWFRESVPVEHNHYCMEIYNPKTAAHKYHKETYGDPNEVGWKDLIDEFKPEKFDADEWVKIFQRGGARFGGFNVMWVDNVALWDSRHTRWDVKELGPKRDIAKEVSEAFRKQDLPFIATFHNLVSWQWMQAAGRYDGKDEMNLNLYNEVHEREDPPSKRLMDFWLKMARESVTHLEPDGTYFDYGFGWLPDSYVKEYAAFLYNWGQKNGKDTCLFHKHSFDKFPTGVWDFERSRSRDLIYPAWMNDKSIGKSFWYYNKWRQEKSGLYSTTELIRAMIDIVSKNGIFFLNVAPNAHGEIPADQQKILLGIGDWLQRNGEAIYATRPWEIYGEGPFMLKYTGARIGPKNEHEYTAADVRFTRSKDQSVVYAMPMARPEGEALFDSFFLEPSEDARIRLLGYGEVGYELNDKGRAIIQMPELDDGQWPKEQPVAFAFEGFRISKHYDYQ